MKAGCRWIRSAAVAVAALLGCSAAQTVQGQTYHVSAAAIEMGSWSFNPLWADGTTPQVVGYLALADLSTTSGDNIVAIWYSRDLTTSTWTAKAWDSATPWEAVKTIKTMYAISDDEDGNWSIQNLSADVISDPPKDYDGGVLAGDPLEDIVNSAPERDTIIGELVAMGYKAADVPLDKDDGCTKDLKLNVMATADEETLTHDPDTAAPLAYADLTSGLADCNNGGTGTVIVIPLTPTTPTVTPGYNCVPSGAPGSPITTCQYWTTTEVNTEGQLRIRICQTSQSLIGYPCGVCLQTRTKTRVVTIRCCWADGDGVGCPNVPIAPVPVYPTGAYPACDTIVPVHTSASTTWGAWTPPCSF